MEQIGVMSEEAWSSLSGMYSSKEEAEFLAQLLSGFSSPSELNCGLSLNGTPSGFWGSDQETSCSMMSLVCSSDFCNSAECLVSQETSTFSPDDGQSVLYLGGGFFLSDDVTESGYDVCPSVGNNNVVVSDSVGGLSDQYAPESKKRSRNVEYVTRRKRHLKSGKYTTSSISDSDISGHVRIGEIRTSKIVKKTDEEDFNRQIIRGETHASRTSKGSGGKVKECKGSPSNHSQSLYARKRRERINERLRILQSLVPNGTKVDISTMLEEAVLYVKFLQLQIKLLSSDETWMYAPLAYNGMDIGISNIDIDTTSPR